MIKREIFEVIVPGMKWETHLRFAASYHCVELGILLMGKKSDFSISANKEISRHIIGGTMWDYSK